MDQVLQIFTQLGVDQSIFYQFALFGSIFFILKFVLFEKLLFVIKMREAKTGQLIQESDLRLQKAGRLAGEYNEKIQLFREEAQNAFDKYREELEKEKASAMEREEGLLTKSFEEEKKEMIEEVAKQKKVTMENAGELSNSLIKKLTS